MLQNTWPQIARVAASAMPIVGQYIASGGTLFFSAVCHFSWFIILARCLGVSQFGELMVITAVNALAATMCGMGCGDAVVRRTTRRKEDYQLMLGHGLLLIGATGSVLTVASVLVLKLLVGDGLSTLSLALFSFTNIMLFSFIGFTERVFIAHGDLRRANSINGGFSLVRVVSAALGCFVFGVTTLGGWALWTAGAHAATALACLFMLWGLGAPIWRLERKELVLGFHFGTPHIFDALRQNVDRIMLGMVVPSAALGSYATAARTVQVSQIVVNSLNRIMYPKFCQKKDAGFSGVQRLAFTYGIAVIGLAAVTAYGLYLIAPLLPLLLGESYKPVIFDMRVLCWLLIPFAAQTVPYDLFGAFDRHGTRARLYNSMSIVAVVGTAAAIYKFQLTGAFVAAYVVETGLAAGLWLLLLGAMRAERRVSSTRLKEVVGN